MGFTRAQSTMFLFNTLALEIVVLSIQFEAEEEQVKINPAVILAEATIAAMICIPGAWIFAALFEPAAAVRFTLRVVKLLFCFPCYFKTGVRVWREEQQAAKEAEEAAAAAQCKQLAHDQLVAAGGSVAVGASVGNFLQGQAAVANEARAEAAAAAATELSKALAEADAAKTKAAEKERREEERLREERREEERLREERREEERLREERREEEDSLRAISLRETSHPTATDMLPQRSDVAQRRLAAASAVARTPSALNLFHGDAPQPQESATRVIESDRYTQGVRAHKRHALPRSSNRVQLRQERSGAAALVASHSAVYGVKLRQLPTKRSPFEDRPRICDSFYPSPQLPQRSPPPSPPEGSDPQGSGSQGSGQQGSGPQGSTQGLVGPFRCMRLPSAFASRSKVGFQQSDSLSSGSTSSSKPTSPPVRQTSLSSASSGSENLKRQLSWRGRDFSMASLDTLLHASLRRTLRSRPLNRARLCHILAGWVGNYLVFVVMQLAFIAYGCKFATEGWGEEDEDASGSGNATNILRILGNSTDFKISQNVTTISINHTNAIISNVTSSSSSVEAELVEVNATNGTSHGDQIAEYLLLQWMISVGQRFLIAEPIIILLAFFIPICFASEFASNFCGETVNNLVGIVVQVIVKMFKG